MTNPKKILIIDDEVDLCYLMESYFKKDNHQVFIAHSLTNGKDLMEKIIPDILFLDNNLPDGVGWAHANYFFEKNPTLRLYLMSGYHPQVPQNIPNKDFTILPKPISFNDLGKLLL